MTDPLRIEAWSMVRSYGAHVPDSLTSKPRRATGEPGGFGLAEFADRVIEARTEL